MMVGILALLMLQGVTAGPPLSPVPHTGVAQPGGDATVLGAIGAEDASEIEVAKLANTKASNGDVKAYATMLLHDHQQSLTTGTDLAKRFRITRVLPADSTAARMHTQEMAELNVLSGTAFDKAFVQFEADGHKTAVARDSALLVQAVRPQVKAYVRALLPTLATHQDIAEKWLTAHP